MSQADKERCHRRCCLAKGSTTQVSHEGCVSSTVLCCSMQCNAYKPGRPSKLYIMVLLCCTKQCNARGSSEVYLVVQALLLGLTPAWPDIRCLWYHTTVPPHIGPTPAATSSGPPALQPPHLYHPTNLVSTCRDLTMVTY